MDQRLNLGNEVRELKLGSTFNTPKPRTSFHTLKYDFKPASIDLSKAAALDVSSTNQVTVTMPHLDSSGVPKTVFKGNQRNYTKECVLIIDKVTGEITLEKLHHNIQVKKTRSEVNNKSAPNFSSQSQSQSLQSNASGASGASGPSGSSSSNSNINSNCNTISRPQLQPQLPPPQQQQQQPQSQPQPQQQSQQPQNYLENSTQRVSTKTRVSTGIRKNAIGSFVQRHSPIQGSPSYPHHRSPQQAPAWNANNGQSTLPSIPMIGMDDDFLPTPMPTPASNGSMQNYAMPSIDSPKHKNSNKPSTSSPKLNTPINSQSMQSNHHKNGNNRINSSGQLSNNSPQVHKLQTNHHQPIKDESNEIGVLSSSDSSDSSDSDSNSDSDSDSDSDNDSVTEPTPSLPLLLPPALPNGTKNEFGLLSQDLHLSSNSSDSDSD